MRIRSVIAGVLAAALGSVPAIGAPHVHPGAPDAAVVGAVEHAHGIGLAHHHDRLPSDPGEADDRPEAPTIGTACTGLLPWIERIPVAAADDGSPVTPSPPGLAPAILHAPGREHSPATTGNGPPPARRPRHSRAAPHRGPPAPSV